jgi:hypothetical protein
MVLSLRERLTPSDQASHRRYSFEVPNGSQKIVIDVRYAPKYLSESASAPLVRAAIDSQTASLGSSVGTRVADAWSRDMRTSITRVAIPNLVTVSLDDAHGAYRGAAHRQPPEQRLEIGVGVASPGFVAGPLPPGSWRLTLTAHTLASPQCDVSIQIGAETASSSP